MTPEQIAAIESAENLRTLKSAGFKGSLDAADQDRIHLLNALDAALSQAEANRVDAERYRVIRNEQMWTQDFLVNDEDGFFVYGARLDAAIDSRLTNAVKTKG